MTSSLGRLSLKRFRVRLFNSHGEANLLSQIQGEEGCILMAASTSMPWQAAGVGLRETRDDEKLVMDSGDALTLMSDRFRLRPIVQGNHAMEICR